MTTLLTIGEFSRATHLTVKALRYYDEVGLLEPAAVDRSSGYRRYASAQLPSAHVIRRFRDLDMPLEEIRLVLHAPDVSTRDRAIIAHLTRMESALEQTQATIASLKDLLEGKESALPVEFRRVDAIRAIAIGQRVDWDHAPDWLGGAFEELHRILRANGPMRAGPDAALYPTEFFETHIGDVVAYIPIAGEARVTGRVELVDIPGADLAITVHQGDFNDIDKAYAALGTYIAERVLGADGPMREHYVVTADHTDDPAQYRTEVCWPVRRPAD